MHIPESQLKIFMLDSGLVSRSDIEHAELESLNKNISLGKTLVSNGKLTQDDLRKALSHIIGIPFVDLKNEKLSFEILSIIPEPVSRVHNVVAYKKVGDTVEVALLDLNDLPCVGFLEKKLGLKVLPRFTDSDSLKNAVLHYQKSLKSEFGDHIAKDLSSIKDLPINNSGPTRLDYLEKLSDNESLVRILHNIFRHAIVQNAEDIHIEQDENQLLVRYRLHGHLYDAMILPKGIGPGIIYHLKSLAKMNLDEKNLPQYGQFTLGTTVGKTHMYVSSIPTSFGEKIVLRVLRENTPGLTLESLGFHGNGLETLHRSIKNQSGVIIISGADGSGKTTTAYTMLDALNSPHLNIATVEKSIEHEIKSGSQTKIRPEIGFTYPLALRAINRQDADVVFVGEAEDLDTTIAVMNTSMLKSLVITTMTSNSAVGTIVKLLEMKISPLLIASSLHTVVGQALVLRLNHDNKEKYFLTKSEIETLGKSVNLEKVLKCLREERVVEKSASWDKIPFWKPKKGVSKNDAYFGEVCLQEILSISPVIKDMITKSATAKSIQKQAEGEGMLTIAEDGLFKAVQGLTTVEEVLSSI